MTPEVAARLRLHENDASINVGARRRRRVSESTTSSAPRPVVLGPADIEGHASSSLAWREALHRRLLGLADIIAVSAAVAVVLSLSDQHHVALAVAVGVPLAVVLFKVSGLYDRDELLLVHSTIDEVPLLTQLTALFALGLGAVQKIVLGGTLGGGEIAGLWIASLGTILIGRALARTVARRTSPSERCLVIGEPEQVDRISEKLASSQARAAVVASLPITGEDLDDGDWIAIPAIIGGIVHELNVHRIIIAPTTTDGSDVVNLIRVAKAVGVRVSLLPRIFEVVGSAVEFDDVDGMPMLAVRRFGLSRSSWLLKRAFDIFATSALLLVVSPLILGIAAAIWLDSRAPIFFRQVRVGRDGEHFRIFKFRSMVVDAESLKEELRALNEVGHGGNGLFKIRNDPRVTRVGRFLRRTSLDELPQLFNVMLGDMSLVGPRPLVIDEDAQVHGLDRSRLHLTPGMTGPWQVMGSRVPMGEMVGIDYLYVANWSLWLDLKLLLRTARHVAQRGNV